MTDGLLDVVLLRPVPRLKLPGLLGSYKKGSTFRRVTPSPKNSPRT